MILDPETERLLAEQKAYYDARAPEYDDWWERRGRYDLGPEGNASWREEIRTLVAVLDAAPLTGNILEPAAGTGIWTQYLARRAEQVTVVDASPAMIQANKHRLQNAGLLDRVTYEQADLLHWKSDRQYEAVFLAFFVSHLTSALLHPFLMAMKSLLRPGGLLVIVEGCGLATTDDPAVSELQRHEGTVRVSDEMELRKLKDGRTFRIIKRFDDPDQSAAHLRSLGLRADCGTTGEQFFWILASMPLK